jgi:hypothetical protein
MKEYDRAKRDETQMKEYEREVKSRNEMRLVDRTMAGDATPPMHSAAKSRSNAKTWLE